MNCAPMPAARSGEAALIIPAWGNVGMTTQSGTTRLAVINTEHLLPGIYFTKRLDSAA